MKNLIFPMQKYRDLKNHFLNRQWSAFHRKNVPKKRTNKILFFYIFIFSEFWVKFDNQLRWLTATKIVLMTHGTINKIKHNQKLSFDFIFCIKRQINVLLLKICKGFPLTILKICYVCEKMHNFLDLHYLSMPLVLTTSADY